MNAGTASAVATQALDSARNELVKQGDNTPGNKVAEKVISGASQMLDPVKLKKNALYNIIANLLGIGMSAVLGFVGVLFAVLYAMNLKHMN